ncbi:MAG: PEP/pyruvate-binding domain-containing protein [Nanoarchaeota archaeon]|nr:hypothetical protein [Nanoarchaeota archaeon]
MNSKKTNFKITKLWERNYSPFILSAWQESLNIIKQETGFSFSRFTCVYQNEVVEHFRNEEEELSFEKIVGEKILKRSDFLKRIIKKHTKEAQELKKLYNDKKRTINEELIIELNERFGKLSGYNAIIQRGIDFVDKKDDKKAVMLIKQRTKYEPILGKYENILMQILVKISKDKNVDSQKLKLLTKNELVQYLETNKLPKDLNSRSKLMVMEFAPTLKLFSGKKSNEINKLIRMMPNETKKDKVIGKPIYKGIVRGNAQVLTLNKLKDFKEGNILVVTATIPKHNSILKKAKAIVADEGGLLSHAAILCRENKIPGVIGTKIATQVFKDGDYVEVDANKGIVRKIVNQGGNDDLTGLVKIFSSYEIVSEASRKLYFCFFEKLISSYTIKDQKWILPLDIIGNIKNNHIKFYFAYKNKKCLEDFFAKFIKERFALKELKSYVFKNYKTAAKKLQQVNLKAMSDQELSVLLSFCFRKLELQNYPVAILRSIDRSLYSQISQLFKKRGDIQKIIRLISINEKPSYALEEEIEILRLALKLKQGHLTFQTLQKSIDSVYNRFCFTSIGYYNEKARTRKYYENKIKSIAKKDPAVLLKNIILRIKSGLDEKKQFLSKLDKKEMLIAELVSESVFLKDYAKMMLMRLIFSLEPLLREVSRRTGKRVDYIKNLSTEEMRNLVHCRKIDEGFVKKRLEQAIFLTSDRETYLLTGANAQIFEGKILKQNYKKQDLFRGRVACKGFVRGQVKIVLGPSQFRSFEKGSILVTSNTAPEFVPIMKNASAIIAEEGGLTAHVSVLSRELRIPCIVGVKNATQMLKDGDYVEVDANKGVVRKIKCKRCTVINKRKNYQRLFHMKGHYYLLGSFFRHNYQKLNFIALTKNNDWTSYLPKISINKALNDGLKLMSSNKLFNEYVKNYNQYKKDSIKFFETIDEKISKSELEKYLNLLSESFVYYSRTEYIYTDKAFQRKDSNKIIKKNLKQMEAVKLFGRKHLNKLFIDKNNALEKLLEVLSKQFFIKIDNLKFYSKEELLSLFDKKILSLSIIKQRKKAYVLISENQKTIAYEGKKAQLIIDDFKDNSVVKIVIKGKTASQGKARGRVKVIVYNSVLSELKKHCQAMNKGDVLIAETTSPDLITACHKASAIVTNQGGQLSHAAIISREMNIPCIVATNNATQIFKDGDYVEVDADKGIVRKIKNDDEQVLFDKIMSAKESMTLWISRPSTVQRDEFGYMILNYWAGSDYMAIARPSGRSDYLCKKKKLDLFYNQESKKLNSVDVIKKHFEKHRILIGRLTNLGKKALKLRLEKKLLLTFYTSWIETVKQYAYYFLSPYFVEYSFEPKLKKQLKKIRPKTFEKDLSIISNPTVIFDYQKYQIELIKNKQNPDFKSLIEKYFWIPLYTFKDSLLDKDRILKDIRDIEKECLEKDIIIISRTVAKNKKEYKELFNDLKKHPSVQLNANLVHEYVNMRTERIDIFKKAQARVKEFYVKVMTLMNSEGIPVTYEDVVSMLNKELIEYLKGKMIFDISNLKKRCNYEYVSWADKNKEFKFIYDKNKIGVLRDTYLKPDSSDFVRGISACKGIVHGKVRIIENKDGLSKFKKDEILITQFTIPTFFPQMKQAKAIVTNDGGITCHAAIISRELKKPCVVGTKYATQIFKNGDLVLVNANHGFVRRLKKVDILLSSKGKLCKTSVNEKRVNKMRKNNVKLKLKEQKTRYVSENILWFKDLNKNDIPIVGGKGANLGEMFSKFPIPDGFCITVNSYKHFLDETMIGAKIHGLLDKLNVEDIAMLDKTSKIIREMILTQKFPADIRTEILENYKKLSNKTVAVRSSATAEDLPTASFAGQQDTYLNIKGNMRIIEAVQKCWASLFTSRAIYYREKNNFKHRDVLISVVIQEMIDPEYAGVMFTIDPVNKKHILIELVEGLGEQLVSGQVTPNTYFLNKKSHVIEEKIEHFVVDEKIISEVSKVGELIEKHYDKPMDVEFVFDKNKKLFIVQARPITTL